MKGIKQFWNEQADWSQRTFGLDFDRGPLGAAKHLRKEVDEVIEHLNEPLPNRDKLLEEFADCLFLLFDSTRRAGFGFKDLIRAAFVKLAKNKTRIWPKNENPNEPTEHQRGVND